MKLPELKNIHRIVIFRTDRIGEVLLGTPVIEALKNKFPQAEITFITSPYAKDILSGRIDLYEVINFSTINRRVSLLEALALGLKLRSRRFNLAVILNPHKMLHLSVFLASIPHRIGFDRKWGFLLNHKREDYKDQGKMHEVEYNLGLLETVGIKAKTTSPFIDVKSGASDDIERLFKERGIAPNKKTIIIHPGSSNPAKQWPAENFIDLIRSLTAGGNLNIIVVGDSSERAFCERIVLAAEGSEVYNLAGLFTLEGLPALLKAADLVITNDNGPMHIAAAVGTRVIAIFGRNIPGVGPKRWGPYGAGHIVFHKDPGCSPCYDRDCPHDFKCLRAITPEEVAEKALGTFPKGTS